MSNYTLRTELVNNNMPGAVEVQPGTKAEGVLMSSDVNTPFVFNMAGGDSHPDPLCPCDGVCTSNPAFVVNLLPVSGRGGVVASCFNYSIGTPRQFLRKKSAKSRVSNFSLYSIPVEKGVLCV